jgi:hypothetical protein
MFLEFDPDVFVNTLSLARVSGEIPRLERHASRITYLTAMTLGKGWESSPADAPDPSYGGKMVRMS